MEESRVTHLWIYLSSQVVRFGEQRHQKKTENNKGENTGAHFPGHGDTKDSLLSFLLLSSEVHEIGRQEKRRQNSLSQAQSRCRASSWLSPCKGPAAGKALLLPLTGEVLRAFFFFSSGARGADLTAGMGR